MKIVESGIYDVPHEVYHGGGLCPAPSLSSSIARTLLNYSPAHAREESPELNPDFERQERELFDLGKIAHTLMLGDIQHFAVLSFNDWRTKDSQAARDAAYAAGKTPVLAHKMVTVERMVHAGKAQLMAHREVPGAFDHAQGKSERTVVWQCSRTGVWLRTRPDWLYNDFSRILDYKSSGEAAEPDAWTRTLFNTGYDLQAAMYCRAVEGVTGKRPIFQFCVQENYPPFALSVIQLKPAALAMAHRKLDYAIDLWAACLESGNFPGYPARVAHVDPPPYLEAKWLEREERAPVTREMLAEMNAWQAPLKGAAE